VYASDIMPFGQRLGDLQAELRRIADELPNLLRRFSDKRDEHCESVARTSFSLQETPENIGGTDWVRREALEATLTWVEENKAMSNVRSPEVRKAAGGAA
jgi:ElaB/YqjD/DUF883 family membrane-anchored ribosome-binding protein